MAEIGDDLPAKAAMDKLLSSGCEPVPFLAHFLACIGTPRHIKKSLENNRAEFSLHRNEVKRLAEQMQKLAQRIRVDQATETLKDYLSIDIPLDKLLDDQADGLLSITVPMLKGKSRLFLSEDFPIVVLCRYVQAATGHTYYPEIAALITAANGILGDPGTMDPETISKKMRRFNERLRKAR